MVRAGRRCIKSEGNGKRTECGLRMWDRHLEKVLSHFDWVFVEKSTDQTLTQEGFRFPENSQGKVSHQP